MMSGPIYGRRKKTRSPDDFYSQKTVARVHLNTRVRLPPINSDIRGTYACSDRDAQTTLSAVNVNKEISVRFPSVSKESQSTVATAGERPFVRQSKVELTWPEAPQFYFPRAYNVLPPIGKPTSQQIPAVVGDKKVSSTRRRGEHGKQRNSSITRKEKNSPANHGADRSTAPTPRKLSTRSSLDRPQATRQSTKNRRPQATQLSNVALIDSGIKEHEHTPHQSELEKTNDAAPCIKFKYFEDLERLELCKEASKFFESPNAHRRRHATCTGLDPSLITAVETIRDILLRQTMEELCMMWWSWFEHKRSCTASQPRYFVRRWMRFTWCGNGRLSWFSRGTSNDIVRNITRREATSDICGVLKYQERYLCPMYPAKLRNHAVICS